MSEQRYPAHNEVDQIIIDRNYLSADNIVARREGYTFGKPSVDMELLVVDSLGLRGSDKQLVDIGAADANFLYRLRWEFDHKGPLIGIEPNSKQHEMHSQWKRIPEIDLVKRALDSYYGASSTEAELLKESYIGDNPSGIELFEGRAHQLQKLESDSTDVLFSMFMLYHLSEEERALAFQEFKRVLKRDGGVFVMATSGNENKEKHRVFEKAMAEVMTQLSGTEFKAPKPMNAGFTTEKAVVEVPKHFKHVYSYVHRGQMEIGGSLESVKAYYKSLWSLQDQFEPVPSEAVFEQAVRAVVDPVISAALQKDGLFSDTIRRSVIIASNTRQDETRLAEHEIFAVGRS